MTFIPRASVAWQHAFGTVDPTAALAFVSTGVAFNIAGVPLARDAALVEAGSDLQINSYAKIGLSYAGQLASSIRDHSVNGNFTLAVLEQANLVICPGLKGGNSLTFV